MFWELFCWKCWKKNTCILTMFRTLQTNLMKKHWKTLCFRAVFVEHVKQNNVFFDVLQPSGSKWRLTWWKDTGKTFMFLSCFCWTSNKHLFFDVLQPSGSKWRLAWWKQLEKHYVFELFWLKVLKKNNMFFDYYQASGSKILQTCWTQPGTTLYFWAFLAGHVKQPCVFRTFFSHRRATCRKTSGFESCVAENVKKT